MLATVPAAGLARVAMLNPVVCGVGLTSLGQFQDRSLRQGRAWRFVAEATWNLGELLAYLPTRNIELVKLLQVHPKIGAHSKIPAKPQGCIAGDPAAASQNVCNSRGRHLDRAGEFTGAHPQLLQFVSKLLAGVNRGSGHPHLSNGSPQFQRWWVPGCPEATRSRSAIDH